MAYLLQNNTSYPINLSEKLKKVYKRYNEADKQEGTVTLLFHQFLLREMFTDPSFGVGMPGNSRGLLVWHSVGSGKTILAASVLLALMDLRPPVILLPKSLQNNFLDTIDRLIDDPKLSDRVKSRINFVSVDAFNSAQQMKSRAGSLNGKLLICDESHRLFRAIINSTEESNAKKLYEMIMSATDLQILFLTGTPIIKNVFELACCTNMLFGKEILPSNYEIFTDLYVYKNRIHNKEILQNRLFGCISHISTDLPSFPGDVARTAEELERPKDLGITVLRVEMSNDQYTRYVTVRDREDTISKKKKREEEKKIQRPRDIPNMSLPTANKSSMGSYFIESRSISNFAPPLDKIGIEPLKLDKSYFIKDNSPKIFKLVKNLDTGNKPVLVYSQFVKGGLDPIIRYLQNDGYYEWSPREYGQTVTHKKRYAVIAGRVSPSDRSLIIETFNDPSNMYGDVIRVLMVSETGAEGLDLKCVREVHILEPYWDMARIIQIQGRAIRRGSHTILPENERDVKTFIYVSVANKELKDKIDFKEDESIDMKFLIRAQFKMKLIKEFTTAIKEVSIECIVNGYKNCRVCLPNNARLYDTSDTYTDARDNNDPCLEYTTTETIKVKSIEYEGTNYYYKKDPSSPFGYTLYIYDKKLEGYIEFPQSDKKTIQIINLIN